MLTQRILRLVLALLAIKSVNANATKLRGDYYLRLTIEDYRPLTSQHIKEVLEDNGILVDEKSEILIHEEDNYIDTSCFNCIINILPPDHMGASSFNENRPGL